MNCRGIPCIRPHTWLFIIIKLCLLKKSLRTVPIEVIEFGAAKQTAKDVPIDPSSALPGSGPKPDEPSIRLSATEANSEDVPEAPKTAVQFLLTWRINKSTAHRYKYFKVKKPNGYSWKSAFLITWTDPLSLFVNCRTISKLNNFQIVIANSTRAHTDPLPGLHGVGYFQWNRKRSATGILKPQRARLRLPEAFKRSQEVQNLDDVYEQDGQGKYVFLARIFVIVIPFLCPYSIAKYAHFFIISDLQMLFDYAKQVEDQPDDVVRELLNKYEM